MTQAMRRLAEQAHPGFPATLYSPFKQSERKTYGGAASTAWAAFLEAVIESGSASAKLGRPPGPYSPMAEGKALRITLGQTWHFA